MAIINCNNLRYLMNWFPFGSNAALFTIKWLCLTSLCWMDGTYDLTLSKSIMAEICDNAKDDDDDGLIDINDQDCICQIVKPESLIPNPSFEDKKCCPSGRSQLNCAHGWIQASEPTTDYLNLCGWMGWPEFPPPRPLPDGEGFVGFRDGRVGGNGGSPDRNWKEYAGACLLKPLEKSNKYLFDFYIGFVNDLYSPPINVTLFGTTDCKNLPFGVGNQGLGCPTNGSGWVRLGSTYVSGGNQNIWLRTTISTTPNEDIVAIAIGPDCPEVPSPVNTYYYFDNLVLADFESFEFKINEVQHPCSHNFLLEVPSRPSLSYQWYKNGIALLGETNPKLSKMYGEGPYQVRILDGISCKLTDVYEHTIPTFQNSVTKTICNDDSYKFGNRVLTEGGSYTHQFKSKNNCDSMVQLELKVLGEISDTTQAKIFEGTTYQLGNQKFRYKGEYIVHLESGIGCDSIVLLRLDYYKFYFPNIFSPNGDGQNDIFTFNSNEEAIEDVIISIYDRWGQKIYSGDGWDGKNKFGMALTGVYAYIANIKMKDGNQKLFSGSVTLLL
ncbi:MAG: gliding motility-associated C-terminal domain-containing protein [Saprospiraceae bacterium]|nr:gliding motility-associated C-terminal domain-containing protein [Saprospiraceae bacterium]